MLPDLIRPFDGTPVDYTSVAAVWTQARPLDPQTAGDLLSRDWRRGHVFSSRYVATSSTGSVVGVGMILDAFWSSRPGKFHFDVCVAPKARHQGLGRRLFQTLIQSTPQPVTTLTTETSEDDDDAIRFLEQLGFRLVLRAPRSILNLPRMTDLGDPSSCLAADGMKVSCLADLSLQPDWFERFWRLVCVTTADIPSDEPLTPPRREHLRTFLAAPEVDPHQIYVAHEVAGEGAWVGMTGLIDVGADPTMKKTWFTGVRRSHRRRGIATALKIRALGQARAAGALRVLTENEQDNPMLGINLRLGFEVAPALLEYKRSTAGKET